MDIYLQDYVHMYFGHTAAKSCVKHPFLLSTDVVHPVKTINNAMKERKKRKPLQLLPRCEVPA